MKKNQAILGAIFVTVVIAAALYFQKGHTLGLIFQLIPGVIVGALIGISAAWWYTKDDKSLDDAEKNKAITFALGFSTLVTALIVLNSLRSIADYTVIPYALEAKGWGHGSEILLRLIVGVTAGIVFFMLEMALMSKVVPWAALAFEAKLAELATVTPPAAPATPAAATGTAPATGTATPATTPADDKGGVHPIVWIIVIAVIAVLLSPLFGGGGSTQSSNQQSQQQTQQQQNGGAQGVSGTQAPDPNAPLIMPDETPGAH